MGILGVARTRAAVLSIDTSSVTMHLMGDITSQPPVLPSKRLVLALPRPKALKRVVQNAACMGVSQLDLINAWKVSSSYFSSPILAASRLRQEAILGAEQGGRYRIPEIRVHRLFMPFLESLGQDNSEFRLVAHPAATHFLSDLGTLDESSDLTLAIGPEGGWIDREIDSLVESGFQPFRLGDSILRSEVAITAALAQVELMAYLAG